MDSAKIIESLIGSVPQVMALLLWINDLRQEKKALRADHKELVKIIIERNDNGNPK
jgi:hypothetical protein